MRIHSFESGDAMDTKCIDFEENFRIKSNYGEGLNVSIRYKEVTSWLNDY